jgi:hypothetical protein
VADPAGHVHLLWTEFLESTETRLSLSPASDAIMYALWDGMEWSTPVDILPSPDGTSVSSSVAAVDQAGVLHVLWATRKSNLYHSSAPVLQAASARAWTAPLLIASDLPTLQLPAAIVVGANNVLHVAYTTSESSREVASVRSEDGGQSWSAPVFVSGDVGLGDLGDMAPSTVALAVSPQGVLHLGWTMNDGEGFGAYIVYAQSTDDGRTWIPSVTVARRGEADYEADWLSIASRAGGQVLLVWAGIGRPPGRSYRLSSDGGLTWQPPQQFMFGLVGETEATRMVQDGLGNTHLFTPARSGDALLASGSGMRHLCWDGLDWTDSELLPGPLEKAGRYGGLATTAAVRLGNEFLVAYHDQGNGSIEVFHGHLDIPPMVTAVFSATATNPFTSPTDAEPAPAAQDLNPASTVAYVAMPHEQTPAAQSGAPILYGALAAAGLCVLVLVASKRKG